MKDSSELLLLDVNVLLALAWPSHQFHRAATARLAGRKSRWATCALTQLGFIRLSSNPAVTGVRKTPAECAALLEQMTQDAQHIFLSETPAPAALGWRKEASALLGHQQVTDLYLLLLAARHKATLLTFDQRLTLLAKQYPAELLPPAYPRGA